MTDSRNFRLHNGQKGAALAIRITPRSRRNEISGILDDGTVKIRLTAAPRAGEANLALVKFLAEVLQVSPSQVAIVAGDSGRDKLVSILDLDPETVHNRILENLV